MCLKAGIKNPTMGKRSVLENISHTSDALSKSRECKLKAKQQLRDMTLKYVHLLIQSMRSNMIFCHDFSSLCWSPTSHCRVLWRVSHLVRR